jgi:SanA protein
LANAAVLGARRVRNQSDPARLPACAVAVVPGTSRDVTPGVRNRHLDLRIEQTMLTWNARRAERIVVSGGATEVGEMREELEAKGVPATAIVEDPGGVSTLATVRHSAELAHGRPVVFVGESWHVPRALFYARALGIEAVGSSVHRPEPLTTVLGQSLRCRKVPAEVREVAARVKAVAEVLRLRTT